MTDYLQNFSRFLARTGALFFAPDLKLRDGRPTPYFVNLGQVNTGPAGLTLAGFFADMLVAEGLVAPGDVLIGPSYKGSALAALAAAKLWLDHGLEVGFDYDRKEFKSHGEATGGKNIFVSGALKKAAAALILDDVASSMATKVEMIDKIRRENAQVLIKAVVIGVDREQSQPAYDDRGGLILGVKGQNATAVFEAQTGIPVRSVAPIGRVIEHLYQNRIPVKVDGQFQPLGQETKAAFDLYQVTYGRG